MYTTPSPSTRSAPPRTSLAGPSSCTSRAGLAPRRVRAPGRRGARRCARAGGGKRGRGAREGPALSRRAGHAARARRPARGPRIRHPSDAGDVGGGRVGASPRRLGRTGAAPWCRGATSARRRAFSARCGRSRPVPTSACRRRPDRGPASRTSPTATSISSSSRRRRIRSCARRCATWCTSSIRRPRSSGRRWWRGSSGTASASEAKPGRPRKRRPPRCRRADPPGTAGGPRVVPRAGRGVSSPRAILVKPGRWPAAGARPDRRVRRSEGSRARRPSRSAAIPRASLDSGPPDRRWRSRRRANR